MSVFFYLLYLVPKKSLSRCVGFLVSIRLPWPLAGISVYLFAKKYRIDLSEAEWPVGSYRSIGELFVRRLKAGLRPTGDAMLVHPADAKISQAGKIADGVVIQAKSKFYSLLNFLGAEDYVNKLQSPCFLTYYLCPTDYHRVHSPISGIIKSSLYIPGNLWPVNQWSTENIDQLFAINERVVIEIEQDRKSLFLVMVGATNVGKMSFSFDKELTTNQASLKAPIYRQYENIQIKKGEELGCFHMGSTVVLILEEEYQINFENLLGSNTRVGQNLL